LAGHVARLGRTEMHTALCSGNLKERDSLEDPVVNGSKILKITLRK